MPFRQPRALFYRDPGQPSRRSRVMARRSQVFMVRWPCTSTYFEFRFLLRVLSRANISKPPVNDECQALKRPASTTLWPTCRAPCIVQHITVVRVGPFVRIICTAVHTPVVAAGKVVSNQLVPPLRTRGIPSILHPRSTAVFYCSSAEVGYPHVRTK